MLLLSSALGAASIAASNPNATSTPRASFDLTAYLAEGFSPQAQPSPYCNIGSPSSPFVIMCYTPQDIKTAYNYPTSLTGAGQTIVILDAFGSPTVQSDLNTFDAAFGLPATTIQIVCQNSICPVFNYSNPDEVGWTQEIALDTQYAHAMAPAAHIVLFVATSDDDLVLEQAAQQAINMFPHSILSQSFGDPELDLLSAPASYVYSVLATGEQAYLKAALEGTTVFASAGDWGADNSPFGFTAANPAWPSSSPYVTAIGGAMGSPYYLGSIPSCSGKTCSTGLVTFKNTAACQLDTETPTETANCIPVGYGSEQVWNEPAFGLATGGAPSIIFGIPSYQKGLGLTSRSTPDVAYNAPVDGGVLGYWSVIPAEAGFYIFGGTSAGSPQWSAIAALADQLAASRHMGTIGFINPALYVIGNTRGLYTRDFHDITTGNNTVYGSPYGVGFSAHPGWDDATGWGTPNVSNLVNTIVSLAG